MQGSKRGLTEGSKSTKHFFNRETFTSMKIFFRSKKSQITATTRKGVV